MNVGIRKNWTFHFRMMLKEVRMKQTEVVSCLTYRGCARDSRGVRHLGFWHVHSSERGASIGHARARLGVRRSCYHRRGLLPRDGG